MFHFKPELPQNTSDPTERARQVAETRDDYVYDYTWPPEVAMPHKLIAHDTWTAPFLVKAVEVNAAVLFNGVASDATTLDKAAQKEAAEIMRGVSHNDLTDKFFQGVMEVHRRASTRHPENLQDYAGHFATIDKPAIMARLEKKPTDVDKLFAWQRLAGANPMVIRRVSHLPPHFPVTEAHYKQAMGHEDSLEAAGAEGRLYLADYALLNGATSGMSKGRMKFITAPLAAFAVRKGTREFCPVAIQCEQTPGPYTPVFTPRDGWRWRIAMTFVQVADANIHEAIEHLGCTHLVVGAVAMGMRRQLAKEHPLRILMEPHVHLTFAINDNARHNLVAKGGTVDQIMGGTIEATLGAVKAGIERFSLQDSAPSRALEARGVHDTDLLPEFPYREDSVPVWEAIERFVRKYIALYYQKDQDVLDDYELRAWVVEMGSHDGGRLQNLRPVNTTDDLVELITNMIFLASAQHAAVNFTQFPFMGDVSNMPGAAWASPPDLDTPNTEDAFLARLPPWDMAVMASDTVWQLCNIRINHLGKYPLTAFLDLRVRDLIKEFERDLEAVEAAIEIRDAARLFPYPYLRPSTIPASIHI